MEKKPRTGHYQLTSESTKIRFEELCEDNMAIKKKHAVILPTFIDNAKTPKKTLKPKSNRSQCQC